MLKKGFLVHTTKQVISQTFRLGAVLIFCFIFLTASSVLLVRFFNPPFSSFMVRESNFFQKEIDYSWTPILGIGILTLASIGNIMLGLLAYSAHQDGLKGANMMLAGAFMLSIQVVIFDGIVWNVKFPW